MIAKHVEMTLIYSEFRKYTYVIQCRCDTCCGMIVDTPLPIDQYIPGSGGSEWKPDLCHLPLC